MLPENVFDPFLRSLSSTPPDVADSTISAEVIPRSFAGDGTSEVAEPAVRLWFSNEHSVGYDQAVRAIRRELGNLRHKDTDIIAGDILAVLAAHPEKNSHPTAVLNSLLNSVVGGELSQFAIFKAPPAFGFQRFTLGEFLIGELKIRNLRDASRTAGSDYFGRYRDRLIGRFTIERKHFPVKVIDWNQTRSAFRPEESHHRATIWNRAIESYFGQMSDAYISEFWDRLDEAQQLLVASGAPALNVHRLRLLPLVEYVSCFMEINGTWGHVFPGLGLVLLDLASMDKRIPILEKTLMEDYGIDPKSPLPPPVRSYTAFVTKALRYETDGMLDDSLLHFVIALELLFSERQMTSESIKRRVALLIHRPLELSLQDTERIIQKLYDARSRYVHAGQAIEPSLVPSAKKVCQEILWTLLRRTRTHSAEADIVDGWTKDIDYLYSALQAGKRVTNDEWIACGVQGKSG
jgi:hypothetical protein